MSISDSYNLNFYEYESTKNSYLDAIINEELSIPENIETLFEQHENDTRVYKKAREIFDSMSCAECIAIQADQSKDLFQRDVCRKIIEQKIEYDVECNEYNEIISLSSHLKEDNHFVVLVQVLKEYKEHKYNDFRHRQPVINLLDRIETLREVAFQRNPLSIQELFRLAAFVDLALPKIALTLSLMLPQLTGLEQEIIASTDRKRLYIVAPLDKAKINETGAYKQVISGIEIDRDFALSAPKKIVKVCLKKDLNANEVSSSFQELQALVEMSGVYGVINLKEVFCELYRFNQDLNLHVSPVFILDGYQTTLAALIKSEVALSLGMRFQIARDLIYGLYNIHFKKRIHADIKSTNILVRQELNFNVKAVFCDFGFSFSLKDQISSNFVISTLGYYGSIDCTPPELLSELLFNGDYYKLDVWALGILLYHFFCGAKLPWEKDVYASYQKEIMQPPGSIYRDLVARQAALRRMEECYQTCLDNAKTYTATFNDVERPKMEKMVDLIFKMLKLDPKERITMLDAVLEMNQLILS